MALYQTGSFFRMSWFLHLCDTPRSRWHTVVIVTRFRGDKNGSTLLHGWKREEMVRISLWVAVDTVLTGTVFHCTLQASGKNPDVTNPAVHQVIIGLVQQNGS